MRQNLPVTQKEYPLQDGAAIISRTDQKGHITFCNDEFIIASGYARSEVIGEPHNLLRHPDMPPEAYRDMWATLEAGRPWSGIVKNRRKNGDHYWVKATATPLTDGSGYMSVRIKAPREEIAAAEALYARMWQNPSLRLEEGQLAPSGPMALLSRLGERISLSARIRLLGAGLAFACVGLGASGLYSLGEARDALQQLATTDPQAREAFLQADRRYEAKQRILLILAALGLPLTVVGVGLTTRRLHQVARTSCELAGEIANGNLLHPLPP
ncbi:PAS domain-containing protein, partial [Zoogloea sp.]|uniref:PAS domain-containing protein n=1 Tax=Zoogloea sp. TaxID=49181 RepID=UPI00260537CE